MEKEYIVILNADVDFAEFNQEMIDNTGAGVIPNRTVDIADARLGSQRSTHYSLTDEEAEELKNDSRVLDVVIPLKNRDDVKIILNASQSGNFAKTTSDSGSHSNWALRRCIESTNIYGASSYDPGGDFKYTLDGAGVDVVIQDSGIQADHPEFFMDDTSEYVSTTVANDSSNGTLFDRQVTSHGLKIVVAGPGNGPLTVPTLWAEKVAQVVKLLIDPTGTGINIPYQKNLIATLAGSAGTVHEGLPTAQRVAYGGGPSYSPNFLLDENISSYSGYQAFLDGHMANDMVWYKNTSGPDPSEQDRDIEEIMEHLFHTIHLFGIYGAVPGSETAMNWAASRNPDWQTTELHLAMAQAVGAGKFDPSGYGPNWATNTEDAEKAYKEYTYLLNWGMWDMSAFWDGASLSPEWTDDVRTPAGIQTHNPLGFAMFNKYFAPVLSKPSFTTLKSIFLDNSLGESGYIAHTSYNRVKEIDWFLESGLSGTQHANHYRDYDGHGTHVAGTAVGTTYGWAKKARIYSVKLAGLEGTGDTGTSLSSTDAFDVIRVWHNSKSIDSATGYKRPTVVNMSWGTVANIGPDFTVITGVNYRGTTYNTGNDARWHESNNYMAETYGLIADKHADNNYHGAATTASVDTDIEEMITAGIHVIYGAGNSSNKIDVSTGVDWNNTLDISGTPAGYYHQSGSPYNVGAISVGSIDSDTYSGSTEQISSFSVRGAGVDLYAPGSDIRSAFSTTNEHTDSNYYLNSSYKQGSISGTSMASPQVCGLAATVLQLSPHLTPAQLKQKMTNMATDDSLHTTSLNNDYANKRSLLGSANKFLNTPFNSQYPLTTS